MKKLCTLLILAAACVATQAQSIASAGSRVGLGQDTSTEPAKLKNLRLSDPLVRQKYLNEPDMLRFLRGTYSEACARGLVKNAADGVRLDRKGQYSVAQRDAASLLAEGNRIWKMTSFEMEALFGAGYLNAANYCDCLMKEVSDQDLVDPKKGLEVIEKISPTTQTACEQNARETSQRQMEARRKKSDKKD